MDDPKKVIVRFVEELWNQRRLDVAEEIFSQDCVTHQLRSGMPADSVPRGPEAMKEHIAGWITSFPDLHFSIEQMLTEGDRVVMDLRMEGTHRAAWLGIPPTGRKIEIRMFTVHRIAQNKIVEDWVLVETFGLFQQLGMLPDATEVIRNFVRHDDSENR